LIELLRGVNLTRKNKMLIPIIIVLLVTVITMVLMILGKDNYKDVINKNVYVNGVAVGNMTKEQATGVLNEKFNKQFDDKKIQMTYENKSYSISFKALKAHYDVNNAVEEAFNYDKNSGIISNLLKNIGLKSSNQNISLRFLADTSIVDKEVKKISKKIDYKPKDAKISLVDKVFNITNDVNGLKVDSSELTKLIKAAVDPNSSDDAIEIPVTQVEAKVKADMLSKIDTPISSFTTSFRTSDAARSGNIRIAATAVDGAVILPGEIFSMNKEVGPRVASKGYQEAHVIINGTLTTGLAGGICQATTTLYNAALLANFEIVSRRGHGLHVGYVKPGLDATISGDYIDMKFRNTNKYPIYIHTIVRNGTVTATIYGSNEHPGQTVELESHVLEKLDPPAPEYVFDPTLKKGEKIVDVKSSEGMKSEAYRKVFQNGVLIKTELLSKDKYKAGRAKIRIGTRQN
jgi:vancomycin resistance protein YoaR